MKKITALALAIISILCMFTAVPVYAAYTVTKSVETGFEISTPAVTQTGTGYASVRFDVKNTLWSKTNADIKVEVLRGTKMVGSLSVNRFIGIKGQTPINLEISEGATGTIKINITVTNPYAREEIYVAPYGDDRDSGSYDKPIKTVAGAINRLKEFDDDYYEGKDVEIVFVDGFYDVNETILIDENVKKKLNSLTFKSENRRGATLVGGLKVSGKDFILAEGEMAQNLNSDAIGKVYYIDLAKYGLNFNYTKATYTEPMKTTLYYNNVWQTMARYPNDTRLKTDSAIVSSAADWSSSVRVNTVTDSDIDEAHKNAWLSTDISETWAHCWLYYDWEESKGRLTSITDTGLTIEVKSTKNVGDTKEKGTYYIYNMPYEIDVEGEYAILGNKLYYYPSEEDVANGNFLNAEIELNCDTTDMMSIKADNISIENLAFKNMQADFIEAEGNNLSILGCEFYNSSGRAVYINGNNNLVSACDFHDLGGVGVAVSGGDKATLTPSGSVLENCYFYNNGIVSRTGSAAFTLAGVGVTARRNTIRKTPHQAVNYTGNNHIIEYNDFSECLTDGSTDAGIIYTGRNLSNIGTIIQYNYIHHSNSGLGSIYWDDRLSGQRAINNVFEGVDRALFIHAGICNSFNENIIIKKENAATEAAVGFRGRSPSVTDDNSKEVKDENGNAYNLWYTQPFIDGKYSHTYNTFMAHLVGSTAAALGGNYPGVPWQNEAWQNAYSVGSADDENKNPDDNYKHVLNYVDYKQTRKIEETSLRNNHFVGFSVDAVSSITYKYFVIKTLVPGVIQSNLAMNSSDFIDPSTETYSTGNTKANSLSGEYLEKYENVVNNSGIYIDEYRTSIN